jgi:hypothetical protein
MPGHLMGKITGGGYHSEAGSWRLESRSDPMWTTHAESGVLFSSLVNMANRNNGRTGMGLVMASKNLKAIVINGKLKPEIADPVGLTALN